MSDESFTHRPNPDGSYDSICRRCFSTIATEHDQNGLLAQESGHVCNEEDLLRIQNPEAWRQEKFGIPAAPPAVRDKATD
jgi:hypothetical protein